MAFLGTWLGRIAAGLLLLALLAIALWVYASGWAPAATKYPIQGVDVSEAQGGLPFAVNPPRRN